MNIKHSITPRFTRDYNSFTQIERKYIKELQNKILKLPIPPNDEDWKILHQFENDYPEGIVVAHIINHFDRLVYELNSETGEITFTNCRGHQYRGKTYSDNKDIMTKTFSELRKACTTKSQKLAFNHLLNTFKFTNED